MRFLAVVLAVAMVVSIVSPAYAWRHRDRSEPYVEDPRLEAGVGIDLVYNVNETFAVKSENRLDLNNSDITGNTDDWSSKGFQTYLVGVVNLDKLFKK